jgi:hypothetical protein
MAVPWLRRLAAGLSPRGIKIAPGSVHVGYVMGQIALGQVLTESFLSPLSTSFRRSSILIKPITWKMNNRPGGVRVSETLSHDIDVNNTDIV